MRGLLPAPPLLRGDILFGGSRPRMGFDFEAKSLIWLSRASLGLCNIHGQPFSSFMLAEEY